MAFDLSTAKPVGQSAPPAAPRKFDLSTAKPVQRPLDADGDGMQDLPSLPGEPSMPSAPSAAPKSSVLAPLEASRNRLAQNPLELFSLPKAGAEAALSMGTGMIAPFIASARGLIGGYEPGDQEIADATYEPSSPYAQDILSSIGEALMPISDSGADQALLGMVPEVPGGLPHGPRAPKPAAPLTEGKATAARIRKQGIKLTPKEASEITGDKNYFGRTLQAIGGESRVSKDIAAANRPVINKLGQKAVGADSLTEDGLQPVKDAGNAVYSEMSSLGPVVPNNQLRGAIEKARGAATKSTQRNLEIDKFVDGVLNEFGDGQTVDAGQVVNRVRELRRDSSNSYKGEGDKRPTIQQEAVGEAQRAVADALDDFLEMNAAMAGKPELASRYKENRVRLAKVGTVEGATRAGNLNAKEVYEAKKKGAPLEGKLNEVAVAHEYAPESTSPLGSASVLEAPGRNLGLGDVIVATIQNAARHMGVRQLLESDFYQNMIAGKGPEPGPDGQPIHIAEHDTNPNAWPPRVAPEPAPPSIDFEGELGLAPDGTFESLPGGVAAPVTGRNLAQEAGLQLVEDSTPAGVAPNSLRNTPDEVNFEAVNPEDVAPYRVNTDLPFSDARPLSGVQRGAAMDTGDLELLPDAPRGPQDTMPPKPRGKPRQGGAPVEPKPKPAPKAPPAEAQPPEGLSELGAMIDQMLKTKRAPEQALLEQLLGDPAMRGDTTPPPKVPPTDPVMARLMQELDLLAAEQPAEAAGARVQNNASGESSASVEAVNRVAAEKAAGQDRFVINPDGTVIPLVGVDAVDASAKPGQVIVQKGVGAEKFTILDRGGLPAASARGRVNAALSSLEGG